MNKHLGMIAILIAAMAPLGAWAQAAPSKAAKVVLTSFGPQDQDDRRDRDDDDHRRHDRDDDYYRNRGRGRNGNYQGVLAPEYQQRFDSYYTRWLQYRATNNRDEMDSMERRMREIMTNYRIPADVPYAAVASPNIGGNSGYYGNRGYGRGDGDADDYNYGRYGRNQQRLSADDQRRFDSYYSRWIDYRRRNDRDEIASMEGRMRDIMNHYNIPSNVPFSAIASQGGYR